MRQSESPRAESGWREDVSSAEWKEDASGPERAETVERSQAEAQSLKHEKLADSFLRSYPVEYVWRQYPGDLLASVESKENS